MLSPSTRRARRGCGELQACQPHLGARGGCGAIHPECHHIACTGHLGDQTQSAWVYERPLTLFLTAFSQRNWLLMAWMRVLFAALKAGWMARPKESWHIELSSVGI